MDWLSSTRARAARLARLRGGAAILAMGLAVPLAGCDQVNAIGPTSCDRSAETNMPILYTEGSVEGGIYMTSPWDGELLDFPGGRRYQLEHQLGAVPRFFQAYLSFNPTGILDGGTVAPAAGNQVEVNDVTDTSIVVINGSCVDYWLLMVAGAGDVAPDGAGGAGGD